MDQRLEEIFINLEHLTKNSQNDSFESLLQDKLAIHDKNVHERPIQWIFVEKLMETVTKLSEILKNDETILISVKNQKFLKSSFQLITSIGLVPCLIPGVGIALNKRSENASKLPTMNLSDLEKYDLLTICTNFIINSYRIPVLKSIILGSHLADYLAVLIQLSYAPLKKPGVYGEFTMTQEMYEKLMAERSTYACVFENLVSTCFQPIIMKELLILQSVTEPSPPAFVKRIISKELSKRLLAPGGLLSLIRCFIESQTIDVGQEWKKIDMIKRIAGARHGNLPEEVYVTIICKQLKEILSSNNVRYYSVAAACLFHLTEMYPNNQELKNYCDEIFKCLDFEYLQANNTPPGSIVLTSQETERNVNILHSFFCVLRLGESKLISSNLYVLLLLALKSTKSEELKEKLNTLIWKCLDEMDSDSIAPALKDLLFGEKINAKITVEEHLSGLIVKQSSESIDHPFQEACNYFIKHSKNNIDSKLAGIVFEICLEKLLSLTSERAKRDSKSLLEAEDTPEIVDKNDAVYVVTLKTLEELCAIPKVVSTVIKNSECVIKFIENVLVELNLNSSDECVMIALVLLNTILSGPTNEMLKKRCSVLIPTLNKMSEETNSECSFVAEEVLKMLTGVKSSKKESQYEKVISEIFDNLLPVRVHGIIELTKLIQQKDKETISNRHYVLCLLQENLKDEDSYMYLSAINGIAALGKHCTEDVLNILCKEFLEPSPANEVQTSKENEKREKLRMKVGDVIVKVTRSLGEMAVVHKASLLNTVLCVCKDHDPLVRASALSNLAEIALVLNYRLDTLLYEILVCISGVIESDKSPECRRAAVMVISSLLKGLGKDTLTEMKDSLLPLYRTLKRLHFDQDEDKTVRLHAQIALEELNDIVRDFLFKPVDTEKRFVIGDNKIDVKFN